MTHDAREPWNIRAQDFPHFGTTRERLRALVDYAILAPSSHNSQPWRFALGDGHLELWADRTRSLAAVDPAGRELLVSCGAALFHLRLAARRFGFEPEVDVSPSPEHPDLLARLRLGAPLAVSPEDVALFEAIPRRHTNRHMFRADPVSPELIASLVLAANAEGAWLREVASEQRALLAACVAEADRVQGQDRSVREELASWLRPNHGLASDGIPGEALGLSDLAALAAPTLIRTMNLGRRQGIADREMVLASPALVVLGTDVDAPAAWLAAGQALAHVLLRATADGLAASFLNQVFEVDAVRARLTSELGFGTAPQLLVRLGYATETVRPTPRRRGDEVMRT